MLQKRNSILIGWEYLFIFKVKFFIFPHPKGFLYLNFYISPYFEVIKKNNLFKYLKKIFRYSNPTSSFNGSLLTHSSSKITQFWCNLHFFSRGFEWNKFEYHFYVIKWFMNFIISVFIKLFLQDWINLKKSPFLGGRGS